MLGSKPTDGVRGIASDKKNAPKPQELFENA